MFTSTSEGTKKNELFVPKLSKERRQTKVIVPQPSKERRKANAFVPQLSKGRRGDRYIPPISTLPLYVLCLKNFVGQQSCISKACLSILCYFGTYTFPLLVSFSVRMCINSIDKMATQIPLVYISLLLSLYVQDVQPLYGWDDQAKLLQNTGLSMFRMCILSTDRMTG
jgi:hypothetical protein